MMSRGADHRRGFTLLEVMVALAILALALTAISANNGASIVHSAAVYRSTTASLLLRGIVLDIEESYRKDGFPMNDVSNQDCKLPKIYRKAFKCRYDLIGLGLDDAQISTITQAAQEKLATAQQGLQTSGVLDQIGSGKHAAQKDGKDLGTAAKDAEAAGLDLGGLAKGGDLMQLVGVIMSAGAGGMNLLSLCDINLGVLQMSVGVLIGELLPKILKRASDRTRKLIIHLTWTEGARDKRQITVETFATAVSEEEAVQIAEMKKQSMLQGAANPMGVPGVPGAPMPTTIPGPGGARR